MGSFIGVKRPVREADHSPLSSAEVKECVELYIHSPNTPSWHGAKLKHRDNLPYYDKIVVKLNIFNKNLHSEF
jgi:hypothetical protein